MGFKLKVLDAAAKFPNEVNLHALNHVVSPQIIDQVLKQTGKHEIRLRKLSADATIWFCISFAKPPSRWPTWASPAPICLVCA
jgi:hypothetical protein